MKNYFTYDFQNKAIVGTKTNIAKANTGRGRQYEELVSMLAKQPTFKVREKDINTNENKQSFKGLTFKRMEEYIFTQDNYNEKIKEFHAIKKISKAKGAIYPATKKWFLENYPSYKSHDTIVITQAAYDTVKVSDNIVNFHEEIAN